MLLADQVQQSTHVQIVQSPEVGLCTREVSKPHLAEPGSLELLGAGIVHNLGHSDGPSITRHSEDTCVQITCDAAASRAGMYVCGSLRAMGAQWGLRGLGFRG